MKSWVTTPWDQRAGLQGRGGAEIVGQFASLCRGLNTSLQEPHAIVSLLAKVGREGFGGLADPRDSFARRRRGAGHAGHLAAHTRGPFPEEGSLRPGATVSGFVTGRHACRRQVNPHKIGRVIDRVVFRPLFQHFTEASFRRLAREWFHEPRPKVLGHGIGQDLPMWC
jgi:hypothetical protein